MTGRPSKRTPEREQRLLDALRAGNTRKAACLYAGISDESLANWSRRSLDFLDRLTRAEAESEVALVAIVRQAAQTDWRAGMALLERRFPDSWGRRDRVDIEVYVRRRASELGLDPDEALAAVRPQLRMLGG
jgi:transposase